MVLRWVDRGGCGEEESGILRGGRSSRHARAGCGGDSHRARRDIRHRGVEGGHDDPRSSRLRLRVGSLRVGKGEESGSGNARNAAGVHRLGSVIGGQSVMWRCREGG